MRLLESFVLGLIPLVWFAPPRVADAAEAATASRAEGTDSQSEAMPESQASADSPQDAETSPSQQAVQGREKVELADLAAETATHVEVESLKVEFKRLTAMRMREDGSLLACDGDAKVIRTISPSAISPLGTACCIWRKTRPIGWSCMIAKDRCWPSGASGAGKAWRPSALAATR